MASIAPPIPPLFLDRVSRFLGEEYGAFAAALNGSPVSGLRVNTLKLPPEQFAAISPFPLGERVMWCPSAFVLPSPFGRGDRGEAPGKHPYHLAGLYYLQDPSAMAPAELLAPQPGERVLDLAAAPGGKTTHLAALMKGEGLLVANDIKTKRVNHLAVNVERWGAGNVVITNETPERLADHFGTFFDRVLVDAPCSGEGMFRKDMGARANWSPEMVAGCAARQTNILRVAAKLVRPGGYLLYATCTFAPEENEAVMARFLEQFPEFEVAALPRFPGFMSGKPEWLSLIAEHAENAEKNKRNSAGFVLSAVNETLHGAMRLFPHRVAGEGHFICLLQRRDGIKTADEQSVRAPHPSHAQLALWTAFARETLIIDFETIRLRVFGGRLYLVPEDLPDISGLRVVHPGVWLGNFKKNRFEPAHPLALYLHPGQAKNVLNLPSDGREIVAYLRGESITSDGTPGWVLVSVDGWPFGWGKRVQGVVKNHYPRGWVMYS